MRKVILLSIFLSASTLAGQELDILPVAAHALLEESRGMANFTEQDNITKQGATVSGNNVTNAVVLTGSNNIASGSLSGSNGIIMLNLSSGNNNVTNMSTSINIMSVR